MNKQLCFVVNNQSLYLDKVLVFFNDIPLFFVCRNDKNERFLVLCTDLEKFDYIITSISLSHLRDMLLQKSTMRETILQGDGFWKVISGNKIEDDSCQKITLSDVDLALLPKEGAFYEKVFADDTAYIKQIESEHIKGLKFDKDNTISIESNISFLPEIAIKMEEFGDMPLVEKYLDIYPYENNTLNEKRALLLNVALDDEGTKSFDYKKSYKITKSCKGNMKEAFKDSYEMKSLVA